MISYCFCKCGDKWALGCECRCHVRHMTELCGTTIWSWGGIPSGGVEIPPHTGTATII